MCLCAVVECPLRPDPSRPGRWIRAGIRVCPSSSWAAASSWSWSPRWAATGAWGWPVWWCHPRHSHCPLLLFSPTTEEQQGQEDGNSEALEARSCKGTYSTCHSIATAPPARPALPPSAEARVPRDAVHLHCFCLFQIQGTMQSDLKPLPLPYSFILTHTHTCCLSNIFQTKDKLNTKDWSVLNLLAKFTEHKQHSIESIWFTVSTSAVDKSTQQQCH